MNLQAKLALSQIILSLPYPPARAVGAVHRQHRARGRWLQRLWPELDLSLPACQRVPWKLLAPTPAQRLALKPPAPVLIGEFREIQPDEPSRLKRRSMEAAMYALVMCPVFRRSLVGCHIIQANAVTMLGTEVLHDGENICVPFWNENETLGLYQRRAVRMREAATHPLTAMMLRMAARRSQAHPVPVPQLCLSVVAGYGINAPWSALGASGGDCPIVICVGTKMVSFTFDHRLWDAKQAGLFYSRFFEAFDG